MTSFPECTLDHVAWQISCGVIIQLQLPSVFYIYDMMPIPVEDDIFQ